MDEFDMPIKVMLIPKAHDTLTAFEFFFISVTNHVSFEMRSPFERLATVLMTAYIAP